MKADVLLLLPYRDELQNPSPVPKCPRGPQVARRSDPTRASTGVVWCTERAYEHGFDVEPNKWANLGQGAPEVDDDIEGSFERPKEIDVSMAGREYGPTAGIKSLRAAVANLYNVSWDGMGVGGDEV